MVVNKSKAAFRTIAEVAEKLEVGTHVLRFWETKFSQLKPMKMSGGRRYYRPDDVKLLECIKDLLYKQCYTIEGVQKLFKEKGVKHFVGEAIQEDFFQPEENQPQEPLNSIHTAQIVAELQDIRQELEQGLN